MWFSSTKVPLRDHEGNITGLVGVSRDIRKSGLSAAEVVIVRFRLRSPSRTLSAASPWSP